MPKSAVRSRRSVATVTSTAVIGASLAVLLLPVVAPPAGAAAAPGSTVRASLASPNNTESPGGGQDSVLSGNGESVAFTSRSRLDPSLDVGAGESQPYKNVFVRDLVRNRTVMISRGQFTRDTGTGTGGSGSGGTDGSGGTGGGGGVVRYGSAKQLDLSASVRAAAPEIKDTPPDDNSYSPSISADGRFVAFSTHMQNLFLEDNDSDSEIVVADRDPDGDGNYDENKANGSKDYKYFRVTNDDSFWYPGLPKLAANASRIVWVQGEGRDELWTARLDLPAGTIGPLTRVPAAAPLNYFLDDQNEPAISGDGNHIVMHAKYLQRCDCNDPPGFHAILSADMRQQNSVTRVDVEGGKPISTSLLEIVQHPAVNVDGSVIAFVLDEHRLVGDDPPREVFPFEPITFAVQVANNAVTRTDIVSRDNAFNVIDGERPGLSSDGRYIAFVTDELRAHDGTDGGPAEFTCIKPQPQSPGLRGEPMLRLNAAQQSPRTTCQVVMRDLIMDRERLVNEQPRLPGTLVSPNRDGNAANGSTVPQVSFSTAPSLSSDGGKVAYDSQATDMVPPDNNRATDVFVRTLEPSLRGDAIDFENVQIGDTSTETAQLTETGFGPVTVEQLSIIGANPGDFAIGGQTCTGQTIHQTGGCQVSVRFTPTAEGARTATLLVQIRGGRRTTVDLRGNGTPVPPTPPQFEAQPNQLNFGNRLLLSTGPTAAVTVTNNGQAPLVISAVDIIGPSSPEDYRVASNTCTAPVPGGGQCTVAIAFSPKASGIRNAVLRFTDNAAGGPHLVSLTGTAPQPTIQVSPGVTPPGRVVTVIGKDFPPGGNVTVKFLDRVGQAVIKAKDDGTFQAALLVFPKAAPETRTIQATMTEFAAPLAATPLLIVFPTVSPANFVVRG